MILPQLIHILAANNSITKYLFKNKIDLTFNICFAILNTPLALMFTSCRYKETLYQRLALPKGPNRMGCRHYSLTPHRKQNNFLKCCGFKILTQWAVFTILVKYATYLAQS